MNKWYVSKKSVIVHSIFALLSFAIAAYGFAWGVGVGIGGGKGNSALIGVFVIGGIMSALYCVFMSIVGIVKRNRTLALASSDSIWIKVLVITVAIIVILPILGFLRMWLGPSPSPTSYDSMVEQSATFSEDLYDPVAEGAETEINFDNLNRAELLSFIIENNIQYCETAHTPLKDDVGFKDCQIMVHINDSIDISFSRDLIMWEYEELHSP